jgi:PhoH-like ATPase
MEPWVAPIRDNLNFLMDAKRNRPRRKNRGTADRQPPDESTYLRLLQERGLIEVEAITFIRGRSIPNAFIIIDEGQNITMHELKTIITRVGEGTKVVITGDLEQIDNVHVDIFTNGLTYAIERFKEHAVAGHVTLVKGERSPLATLASKVL